MSFVIIMLPLWPVNQMSDPQGQCLAAPQALPAPTYKQRVEEFRKLFRELPESERLIVGELFVCVCVRENEKEKPETAPLSPSLSNKTYQHHSHQTSYIQLTCIYQHTCTLPVSKCIPVSCCVPCIFPRLHLCPPERHSTAGTPLPVRELALFL